MPIDKLLAGHRRFKKKFATTPELFVRLVKEGQDPKVLWIGCSDSRVNPERITDAEPGELFVMRNVANVVPPAGIGPAVGTAIEFAVLHLRVSHIVICGHTDCGGIRALEEQVDVIREPHLARWVELARPALSQVKSLGVQEESRYLETIKANVLIQRNNLHTYRCVREAMSASDLTTYGWLYDLYTGDLLAYDDESKEWSVLPG